MVPYLSHRKFIKYKIQYCLRILNFQWTVSMQKYRKLEKKNLLLFVLSYFCIFFFSFFFCLVSSQFDTKETDNKNYALVLKNEILLCLQKDCGKKLDLMSIWCHWIKQPSPFSKQCCHWLEISRGGFLFLWAHLVLFSFPIDLFLSSKDCIKKQSILHLWLVLQKERRELAAGLTVLMLRCPAACMRLQSSTSVKGICLYICNISSPFP